MFDQHNREDRLARPSTPCTSTRRRYAPPAVACAMRNTLAGRDWDRPKGM